MNTKQCKDCVYWKSTDGNKAWIHACHHLLLTGKRRIHKDGVCLSKKIKREAFDDTNRNT